MRYRTPLLLFACWLILAGGGLLALTRYTTRPGNLETAPLSAPAGLDPETAGSQHHLILALHPRCACSRATLRELARLTSRFGENCAVTILMYRPATESDGWIAGTLTETCLQMGWNIRPDPDGLIAGSLGSFTSGTVTLYGPDGRLRFQGGITASRGHEGDNPGSRALMSILEGHDDPRESPRRTPVFGCGLR